MGSVLAPSSHVLIEPCPAPVIPVSGIGAVTQIAGEMVRVTLFQEIPSDAIGGSALAIEYHVAARLIWPRSLIIPSMRKLFALLPEGPILAELPPFGAPHH
jgi:hypothetical protein